MPLLTDDLATDLATTAKTELDDAFLYIYNGPIPASAADALDTGNDHTLLAMISVDGDGTTGLTWDAAANRTILKPSAAVWKGAASFSGANDSTSPLQAHFARLCRDGDDPAAAATTYPRVQFTTSGPGGGGEVILAAANVADGPDVTIDGGWFGF